MMRLEAPKITESVEITRMSKDPAKRTMDEVASEIIVAMDHEFHGKSDRVIAIVGAAYLDSVLDSLLRAVLIESRDDVDVLLGQTGPLGANGAGCQLAYCLGLITRDQRDDLKMIAKIRNKFAHDFHVSSFDVSPVRDYCASLKSPSRMAAMPEQLCSGEVAKKMAEFVKQTTATPREQFRMSVSELLVRLLRRIHFVRREDHKWFSYDPDGLTGPTTTF
jgi:DNA-binding MltR family transcriptional regulator